MKKMIALVLTFAMTVSLTACGTSRNTSEPAASKTMEQTEYTPPKTLTMIVPYAAGGAVDLGARLLAKYAAKYTTADIVINNVAGGSGTIGPAEMLKYKADGTYMCAMNPSTSYVSTPDKVLSYDYMEDFTRVALIMQDQRVIAVPKNNGLYETLEEFIAYAKEHPGNITIGCSGTMNDAYFTPYLLNKEADIDLNIVAYDGGADAKTDLLGGHINAISVSYSEALPMMQNDQVIILCTAGTERFEKLPDTPTLMEKGYNVTFTTNRGYVMKAGTAPEVIAYWSDVIGKVCADEEFLAEAKDMGFPIKYYNHEDFDVLAGEVMTTYKEILAGME